MNEVDLEKNGGSEWDEKRNFRVGWWCDCIMEVNVCLKNTCKPLRGQFQSCRYFVVVWVIFQSSNKHCRSYGKTMEKDAGHNPKSNTLISRSIRSRLTFHKQTWKHGDEPLWADYFVTCTRVLDSCGFY